MHIPDGYLSPATCATLYAGAAPFWYVALRRVKRTLDTRLVPTLSLCAAFSFVLMMFNIPLPGGTTGHAVGMCVTAIVLGPWASILAISAALLIQAVFFGDGGITSYGANCFNMAVVGSLVAHMAYVMLAGRSGRGSKRRIFAAGLAGYLAINAAALCAAVEFGLQPLLFHDSAGTPLYAPYPPEIALPAMMAGHLTFAGLAECVVSAGVIGWLGRGHISLLQAERVEERTSPGWAFGRAVWVGLAVLLMATPLGLLAAGMAWGEWGAEDYASPVARAEMAMASGDIEPPRAAPVGMTRLADIWRAPVPDYAPAFVKSRSFGYLLSAMAGSGLLIFSGLLLEHVASIFKRRLGPDAG